MRSGANCSQQWGQVIRRKIRRMVGEPERPPAWLFVAA
jgi:hypothetical protein